jgi:ribosomal protein L40E
MDVELFRIVLLVLAALGVIGIGVAVASLMAIRKALEEGALDSWVDSGTSQTGERSLTPPYEEPLATANAATLEPTIQAERAPITASQPAPATSAASPATGEGALGSTPDPAASIRSVLEQHGVGDPALTATLSQAAAAQVVEQPSSVESAFAAHADDPQEEPFQRDGRWWFKRGDELLLYDEATGEWQPVGGSPGAGGAGAGAVATQTASVPAVADQVATFWKCATCGAVNGSTAATCRMCFAARP